jgi:hypothetical protein
MLKENLQKIFSQYEKGIITAQEAANKAFDTAHHAEIPMEQFLDSLVAAQEATKQKELLVTRLIQAGNDESNLYEFLFFTIYGKYGRE